MAHLKRHAPCAARYAWAGPWGRRASDGFPMRGLTRSGRYVPFGGGPPSRQRRKSAQHREDAGRRRPFARAKRGSTTGVSGKMRKCHAVHIRPCRLESDPPKAVRQDLSFWARTAAGRTWDTFAQRIATPHLAHLAQAHNFQQLLKKNKNFAFFGRIGRLSWPADGPGADGGDALRGGADCAVGSG